MFDTHLHTDFSSDSRMCIDDALKASVSGGLGLIITEHMDINYPDDSKFKFDPAEYFKKFGRYRSDKLLLGVELGIHEDFQSENRALALNHDFDYVLGSLHFLGNNDIFDVTTYQGKSKREVYEKYLVSMENNIKTHAYIDSLGHIDYICRYADFEDREIYYHEFSEYIDRVLRCIIENEIAFEINSRRLVDEKAVKLIMPIYRRYNELGGKIVTMGSDAHYSENIGINFKRSLEIIQECNLKPVYFKERKPEYVKL